LPDVTDGFDTLFGNRCHVETEVEHRTGELG